ncbi:MAG: hypothetical protein KGL63_13785 [Betaproteobacteria bacterium]|nr:hypothetical protein [Betaproteobacteria bacterium]
MSVEQDNSPEAVAELAVKKVFAILGVDIDQPKEVEQFRENLRFAGTARRMMDKGIMAVAALIAVGAVMAMWAGVQQIMRGRL